MTDAAAIRALAVGAGLGDASISLSALEQGGIRNIVAFGENIYPASMIKTPLALALAVAVRKGRVGWTDVVRVTPPNMTANDAPSPLVPGANATLRELLELMLVRSDNVATNILIDRVGRARATAELAALGFPGTAIRRKLSGALPLVDDPEASGRNVHPAHEAAELFARVALGDVPGADIIADVLDSQYWNTKLSAGLELGDRFAHKTGDTDEVSHDGGILTLASGERYVLVVYTNLPANPQTDRCFGTFMRALRPRLVDRG